MNKLILTTFTALIFLTACTPGVVNQPPDLTPDQVEESDEEMVFCTQDAKLCLDGSYVSRVAPDCSFAPYPELKYKTVSSEEIKALTGPFTFSVEIPAHWQVEAVPAIEAVN